jgi:hypothetical protein
VKVRKHTRRFIILAATFFITWAGSDANAIDSELTRKTLAGLHGVNVVVEELQPNIQKYAQKAHLERDQIRSHVEGLLKKEGIPVLSYDQWLKAPGRPFLYVAINTHEYEKYWYAYDVRVQLRQKVMLEVNPEMATMADTWGINMTGTTNIGKLTAIRETLNLLVGRFGEAYRSANTKEPRTGR